jgi:dihydrofolate reductase
MARVIADITVSLDGYVTAPGADAHHGLGVDGEPLHNWVFSEDPVDQLVLREATEAAGAVVMGRNLFDVIDGPDGWSEEMGFGAQYAARPPFFVVTHRPVEKTRLPFDFTFVDDPATAVGRATGAAGDRNVVVMGGGSIVRQCVLGALTDELVLHISPIVFGGGTPLFTDGDRVELVQTNVRPSANAVHVTYRPAS